MAFLQWLLSSNEEAGCKLNTEEIGGQKSARCCWSNAVINWSCEQPCWFGAFRFVLMGGGKKNYWSKFYFLPILERIQDHFQKFWIHFSTKTKIIYKQKLFKRNQIVDQKSIMNKKTEHKKTQLWSHWAATVWDQFSWGKTVSKTF